MRGTFNSQGAWRRNREGLEAGGSRQEAVCASSSRNLVFWANFSRKDAKVQSRKYARTIFFAALLLCGLA